MNLIKNITCFRGADVIRIGIVEDEEIMQLKIHKCIKEILEEHELVEIRSYDCAEDFLNEVQKKVHFDILFSDIQMLEMNGIELGKRLQKDVPNLYIIYVTAYMEYAVESYKLSAYQYVLKEDVEMRLPQIARKLLNQIQHEYAQFRIVGTNGIQKKIYLRDIIYAYKGKETKYVYYVTTEGEYKERISLNEVWKFLEENGFLKIERAYLVNARHILKLEGNKLFLSDQSQLTISRYRLKAVKLDIAKFWGGI